MVAPTKDELPIPLHRPLVREALHAAGGVTPINDRELVELALEVVEIRRDALRMIGRGRSTSSPRKGATGKARKG